MNTEERFQFTKEIILIPLLAIFMIWFVYWIEIRFSLNFTKYGIYPKKLIGLRGVLLSPFIHGDTKHLLNNSIPLGVLLSTLIYFYRNVYLKILVFGGLFTGFITWMIANNSYHIGVSGIIYMLFSFIFFSGVIKKQFQLIAVSLIVIFLYGSMVWYMLPIKKGISWEGHLSGFITGLFYAVIYRKKGIVKEPYKFTQTEFDLLFDEDGNFNSLEETNEVENE